MKSAWFLAAGATFGIVGHFFPKVREIPAKVINPLLLTAAFFLVITPIGLMRRLFGSSPLALRFDSRKSSYWHPIEKHPEADEIGLRRQF